MSSPSEHQTSVISVLFDGGHGYRATCSCAWRGIKTPYRKAAEAQAEAHMSYRADVDRLTATSAPPRAAGARGKGESRG